MRDLLDLIQNLSEASNLAPGEFTNRPERWKTFIDKITARQPFVTVSQEEVTIDPREARRLTQLKNSGMFKGSIKVRTIDGEEIPLSKLAKTAEFGGGAAEKGGEVTSKEALLLKPSQIGITDRDIPASDLYDTIVNNPVLQSTEYGRVVIQLAQYIVSGEDVTLPPEYQASDKKINSIRASIIDYAGEYLGVLALLYNRSRFPKKAAFEQWLGGTTDDLVINFPAKANTNLADSFAMIKNAATSHSVNISSKGQGGGAPPAISGLKIPDSVSKDPNYEDAVNFIQICQKKNPKGQIPSTITQAFEAIDFIYSISPDSLPDEWAKFLPLSVKNPNLMELCVQSYDSHKANPKKEIHLPNKYYSLFSGIKSNASEGGKVIYNIKKAVAKAINDNDAIPNFKAAILEILEMNFVQQYTDYKSGQLTFATQWPAKLDGIVSVENKSSANDPKGGGFSFKLGRVDDSVSAEPGEPPVDGLESEEDFMAAAANIAGGVKAKKKTTSAPGDVGRKKRK